MRDSDIDVLSADGAQEPQITVSVERLARAMHDSDGWKDDGAWADCNDTHRDRYRRLAERYMAHLTRSAT